MPASCSRITGAGVRLLDQSSSTRGSIIWSGGQRSIRSAPFSRRTRFLPNRREWERFIAALARHRNINKRRAALVFLTGPIRRSEDKQLAELGFRTIEVLKSERAIIITKAVSWLLRSMVTHHKRAVAAYIKENHHSLPAIAVRETSRKIATGRK